MVSPLVSPLVSPQREVLVALDQVLVMALDHIVILELFIIIIIQDTMATVMVLATVMVQYGRHHGGMDGLIIMAPTVIIGIVHGIDVCITHYIGIIIICMTLTILISGEPSGEPRFPMTPPLTNMWSGEPRFPMTHPLTKKMNKIFYLLCEK